MGILASNGLNVHKGGRSSVFYRRAYKLEIRKNLKIMKRIQYQGSHLFRKKNGRTRSIKNGRKDITCVNLQLLILA